MSFKKFSTKNYSPMHLDFDGEGFYFKGNGENDRITGTQKDDHLLGGGGNDILNAGAGNDLLTGGAGNDILKGGSGADIFSFGGDLSTAGVDRICDFDSKACDKILLSELTFTKLEANASGVKMFGALAASNFVIGTSAQDADDRIVYDQASGALFYDVDGNGAGGMVQIAALKAGTALSASDFFII